jgi:hypothetical protein
VWDGAPLHVIPLEGGTHASFNKLSG